MSLLATGLLIMVLAVLAVVYPPAIAGLCLLVASYDTPAVGVFFTHFARVPISVINMLALVAAGSALWRLRCAARTSPDAARKMTVARIAIVLCAWIGLSVFAVTGSISGAVLQVLSCGVYGIVFALTYHRSRTAMAVLLTPVAIHLLLCLGITYLPGSPLMALKPMTTAGLEENVFGVSGDGVTRVSAQFNNAVPLSFHAAAAVIAGIYIVLYSRRLTIRLLGAALLVLGVLVSYMTIERAIWLGIAIGALVLLYPIVRRSAKKMIFCSYAASLLLVCYLLTNNAGNETMSQLGGFFLSAGQDNYRMKAAINSVDILLSRPGFGMGGDVAQVVDAAGGIPHQSFYSVAVLYGIPAGLGVLLLTWLAFPVKSRGGEPVEEPLSLGRHERSLALALGCIVIAMALSNNMSAGMLGWICLGFACLPRIYRRNQWSSRA